MTVTRLSRRSLLAGQRRGDPIARTSPAIEAGDRAACARERHRHDLGLCRARRDGAARPAICWRSISHGRLLVQRPFPSGPASGPSSIGYARVHRPGHAHQLRSASSAGNSRSTAECASRLRPFETTRRRPGPRLRARPISDTTALDGCRLEKGFQATGGMTWGPEDTPLETWASASPSPGTSRAASPESEALLRQRESGIDPSPAAFPGRRAHPLLLHDEPVYRDRHAGRPHHIGRSRVSAPACRSLLRHSVDLRSG